MHRLLSLLVDTEGTAVGHLPEQQSRRPRWRGRLHTTTCAGEGCLPTRTGQRSTHMLVAKVSRTIPASALSDNECACQKHRTSICRKQAPTLTSWSPNSAMFCA